MNKQETKELTVLLDRVPPNNNDAEVALLGAILLDSKQIEKIKNIVSPEDFYNDSNRIVYQACLYLYNNASPVDIVTLSNLLRDSNSLTLIGGISYLTELVSSYVSVNNIESYAKIIKQKSILRGLVFLGANINHDGHSETDDPQKLFDKIQASLDNLSSEYGKIYSGEDDVDKLYQYHQLVDRTKDFINKSKVPTFFVKIDEMLDGGFQGGELIILSGPTKMGKTSCVQTWSYLQAKNNIPSVWFSFEMSWQELTKKFMQMDTEGEIEGTASKLPLYYPIDNRRLSLEWLEQKIKNAIQKYGAKIVYIDHLHFLLSLKDTASTNVSFMLGGIVRELKRIAVRNDIPIVLIAHIKKIDIEDEPSLSDVRDCLPGDQLIYSNGKRIRVDNIIAGSPVISRRSIKTLQEDTITDIWNSGKKEIFRLTTRTGRKIECSDGHKFYALTYKSTNKFGPNQGAGIAGWVPLRDLRVGQKIAVVNKYPLIHHSETITEDRALLLGWIIGDGTISKNYYTEITTNTYEETKLLGRLLKKEFDLNGKYLKYKDKNAYRFYCTHGNGRLKRVNNKLSQWLKKEKINGIGINKKVPEIIFRQPNNVVAKFISGLFHADGSVGKNGNGMFPNGKYARSYIITYSSISEDLARGVQHLLLRFGIISTLRHSLMKPNKFRNKNSYIYTLEIRGYDIIRFKNFIGFQLHKQEKFIKLTKGWNSPVRSRGREIYFDKIKMIEKIGIKDTWDISVRGKHQSIKNNSFCVNDFITHNSSFISQESDFTFLIWRERIKKEKSGKYNVETVNQDELYTNMATLALEANRRNGVTKKIKIGMFNGRFYEEEDFKQLTVGNSIPSKPDEDLPTY